MCVLILHNRKYYGLLNYTKIIIKLKFFISCNEFQLIFYNNNSYIFIFIKIYNRWMYIYFDVIQSVQYIYIIFSEIIEVK